MTDKTINVNNKNIKKINFYKLKDYLKQKTLMLIKY